jgi:hypothetical protein
MFCPEEGEESLCVEYFLLSIFFHFLFSRETSVQCNYGEFCCCCHTKDPKEKENEGEKRRNTLLLLLLLQRRGCKRSFIQRQREEGKEKREAAGKLMPLCLTLSLNSLNKRF